MWANGKRIKIIVGHYGSGKTEIALNMARALRKQALPAALVDLDIVNPFFRSAERGNWLQEQGIELFAPAYALTAVDIPALPADILKVFSRDDLHVIFDVGGDSAGAVALGVYHDYFLRAGYEMLYVVNLFRPRSSTADEILETMQAVELSSRLKLTGLINNANLGGETTPEHLLEGQTVLEQVSRKSGLPIVAACATRQVLAGLPADGTARFEIERLMKPEWMDV